MTAIAANTRNINRRPLDDRNFPVAANVRIYEWAMVAIEVATGLLRPARSGTPTDIVVGVARMEANNTGGAASAISCEIESHLAYAMVNSGGADTITLADIGKDCYAVDDQTVALTNGTSTRPRAGKIHNVTELGVWLRFDQ